ncbi:MAG: GNAT family N-acetyltransferase [Sphaerochaeta sp.]|nr:GNAT family N-acetyltransferase [Sphaerochaeta sp.]
MAIVIHRMKKDEALESAYIACQSLIGKRYALVQESLSKRLIDAMEMKEILLVAKSEEILVGFAWIDPKGAFSSAPYLRLLAVEEKFRGLRVGSVLLDAFEESTQHIGRDYVLLVSDFNEQAIHFYEKHGYVKRGSLPDFAREGITELIMVKKRNKDVI